MSIQCRVPAIQNAPRGVLYRWCPALNFYFVSMFGNLDKNVGRFSQVSLYNKRFTVALLENLEVSSVSTLFVQIAPRVDANAACYFLSP